MLHPYKIVEITRTGAQNKKIAFIANPARTFLT